MPDTDIADAAETEVDAAALPRTLNRLTLLPSIRASRRPRRRRPTRRATGFRGRMSRSYAERTPTIGSVLAARMLTQGGCIPNWSVRLAGWPTRPSSSSTTNT
jgi:hypothetical protein